MLDFTYLYANNIQSQMNFDAIFIFYSSLKA